MQHIAPPSKELLPKPTDQDTYTCTAFSLTNPPFTVPYVLKSKTRKLNWMFPNYNKKISGPLLFWEQLETKSNEVLISPIISRILVSLFKNMILHSFSLNHISAKFWHLSLGFEAFLLEIYPREEDLSSNILIHFFRYLSLQFIRCPTYNFFV